MRRWAWVLIVLLVAAGAAVFESCASTTTDCACDPATSIGVSSPMGSLPDSCVSKSANTQLSWRSSDGSLLVIQIPDWGNEQPTTTINPYPGARCSGTSCASGAFAGGAIPNCIAVRYSVTTTLGATSTKHYGRIIIKP